MKFEINKCKNHVNISDGVPTTNLGGFYVFGLEYQAIKWLFNFPKLFWHQVVCPDNTVLHKLSNWIEKTYKPMSYRDTLTYKKMEQIQIAKKKMETLIP